MDTRHVIPLLTVVASLLVAACDQQQVTAKVEQLKIAAESALSRIGPSDCQRSDVQEAILEQSGFYVDDPVRGYQPLDGVNISLNRARVDESQDDRYVCRGEIQITGPKSTLVRQILGLGWAQDSTFAIEEISKGYNPDGKTEPGLWGMLGSITAVSVLAMTQAFEGDPDADNVIEIRSDIEYAVLKEPKDGPALKAWAWIEGDSPGFHAGALLRPKSKPSPTPPASAL